MNNAVSHSFKEESIEAKTKWFKSLSMEERIQTFCDFTDLALSINPRLGEKKIDKSAAGRIQVLRLKDLEDVRLLKLDNE